MKNLKSSKTVNYSLINLETGLEDFRGSYENCLIIAKMYMKESGCVMSRFDDYYKIQLIKFN